jgi:hypothetical protein
MIHRKKKIDVDKEKKCYNRITMREYKSLWDMSEKKQMKDAIIYKL